MLCLQVYAQRINEQLIDFIVSSLSSSAERTTAELYVWSIWSTRRRYCECRCFCSAVLRWLIRNWESAPVLGNNYARRGSRCVCRMLSGVCVCASVCACVRACVCVCPRCERKTAWAINTKLDTHIRLSRHSAWIDLEVKRSKINVTELWSVLPAWVCMSIWQLRFLVHIRIHIPVS